MNPLQRPFRFAIALLVFISGLGSAMTQAATFAITQAQWSTSNGGRLIVAGSGTSNRTVTIKNAVSGTVLGTDRVDEGRWSRSIQRPSPPPCRVRAEQSGGGVAEMDVANRPANCGPVTGAPGISLNDVTVTEGGTANFTVSLSAASCADGHRGRQHRQRHCRGPGATTPPAPT